MTSNAPSTSIRRDPALDGLRGIAVLLVFVFHYGGGLRSAHPAVRMLGYATEAGWIGVIVFFALSGFLITGSLWDSFAEPHWLRNFYARRALRILPLYYAVLLATALASLVLGARFSELRSIGIYALFLQDLPVLAERVSTAPLALPLYHLWSLAVEEQFYLLWPALLLLARRRPAESQGRALHLSLWIFALTAGFRLVIYGCAGFPGVDHPHFFDSFLLTHAGALALGAALAIAARGGDSPARRSGDSTWRPGLAFLKRWAGVGFLGGVLLYALTSWHVGSFYLTAPLQFTVGLPAVSIAAAALIPLALRPGFTRSLCSFNPLAWLGRISYGFYVFHILLEPLFDRLGAHLSHASSGMLYQGARFVMAFPITLLVAWLSYEFFELPFLRRKRRFPMHLPLPQV